MDCVNQDQLRLVIRLGDELAVAYQRRELRYAAMAYDDSEDCESLLQVQSAPFAVRNAFVDSANAILDERGMDAVLLRKAIEAAQHYVSWFGKEWFECRAMLMVRVKNERTSGDDANVDPVDDGVGNELKEAIGELHRKKKTVKEIAKELDVSQRSVLAHPEFQMRVIQLTKSMNQENVATALGVSPAALSKAFANQGLFRRRGENFRKKRTRNERGTNVKTLGTNEERTSGTD